MKKLLAEIKIEGLTADRVRRKIKTMKTVYSQELNKMMKSRGVAQELMVCTIQN
jgi:hypothetical protein